MIDPCTDPGCVCRDHITPSEHVPCCPVHYAPLAKSKREGYGTCLHADESTGTQHRGGMAFVRTTCRSWREADWLWLPRDRFNGDDLPPHNGWEPPEYDHTCKRFRLDVVRACKDCEQETPHLDVGHTSICLACGYGRWIV